MLGPQRILSFTRAAGKMQKFSLKAFDTMRSSGAIPIAANPTTSAPLRFHQTSSNTNPRDLSLDFVDPSGDVLTVDAAVGDSILEVAHRHEIELEGACEGVCACSTCHVILTDDIYETLAENEETEASEDEEDMLDMAFGLTETSRLGCQIKLTRDMNGAVFRLPQATRNFYVDGHVPKPH